MCQVVTNIHRAANVSSDCIWLRFINPRRACAARVTVVDSVCLSVKGFLWKSSVAEIQHFLQCTAICGWPFLLRRKHTCALFDHTSCIPPCVDRLLLTQLATELKYNAVCKVQSCSVSNSSKDRVDTPDYTLFAMMFPYSCCEVLLPEQEWGVCLEE